MTSKTSKLKGVVSLNFIERNFNNDNKHSLIQLIVNSAYEQGLTLCNQVAYVLATAKGESNFRNNNAEEFAYSKSELQAKWKGKFSDEWIKQNLTFESNSRGKLVVVSSDWHKVANRAYANRNGNGDEKSGDGFRYRGRGFSQITGKGNYERAGIALGLDLVNNVNLALSLENSVRILVHGMKTGLFTPYSLEQYLSLDVEDYVNARRVINGTDKAGDFAKLAEGYERLLQSWRPFKGTFAYDTADQDFIELDDSDNVLYAGLGPKVGESPPEDFDGGLGNDTLNFQGTDGDLGVPYDEFHPGSLYGVCARLGATRPELLPNINNYPIHNHSIINFENLIGSWCDDVLIGSTGKNDIYGADGNDYIRGGEGRDILTGGRGRDTFSYSEWYDSPNNNQKDLIIDFNPKQDRIELFLVDSDERWFSNDEFKFVGKVSRASDIRGGQLGYLVSGELTTIYANINRSNNRPQDDVYSEIRIDLSGALVLTATSFVL